MITCSAGRIDISPEVPCVMGCGDTDIPTGTVRDRLEANVMVLRDSEQKPVVIVAVAALYVGPGLRAHMEEALRGAGVPASRLFMAASHTHYAPMVDDSKPQLGVVSQANLDRVAGALEELCGHLLNDSCSRVDVQSGSYLSTAAVNRRLPRLVAGVEKRVRFNAVARAPNLRATHAQPAHVVLLRGSGGDPVAALVQLPCHPTSLPAGSGHSSHFIGRLRTVLRERYGSTLPVVFLQGFSGDLRPPAIARPTTAKGRVRRVLLGPWFTAFDEEEYEMWLAKVGRELDGLLDRLDAVPIRQASVRLDSRRVTDSLTTLVKSDDAARHVSAHRVTIGDVHLVGFSAEPVAAYVPFLDSITAGEACIPVGCIDDVFGYAPTDTMVREGGYEATGFWPHFEIDGLQPDFERRDKGLLSEAVKGFAQ